MNFGPRIVFGLLCAALLFGGTGLGYAQDDVGLPDAGSPDAGWSEAETPGAGADAESLDAPPPEGDEALQGEPDAVSAEEAGAQRKETAPVGAARSPRATSEDDDELTLETDPAIDAELQGKPIGKITFTCDLPVCLNPIGVEVFTQITGLYIGQPYSTDVLRRAQTRLAKTGFFDKLTVEKRLQDDAVFLTIDASGATLIRKVSFSGIDAPPFESELRKILIYRQGQAFRNAPDKATAQLESIEALYEREGYFGTEVAMVVQVVEERPHQVDLVFRIKKGEQRRICDVGIRGVRAMTYAEARDLLLSDFSLLPRRLNLFPLYFTARGFKEGQQRLIEAYRERGFFQTRILGKHARVEQATHCVTLLVDVAEGPRWEVDFEGNERFSEEELREQLPFFESGYVDSEEIRRAERAIANLYETRGYPFARVEGKESRRDELDRVLTFTIEEGPQLEIRQIEIHGNEALSDEELRDVMSTRPFGLFEVGGYLQIDELLGDFARIEEEYRKRGYLRTSVDRFVAEVEPDEGLFVHIFVHERERTTVSRVELEGPRAVPEGTLLADLSVREGEPFVPLSLRSDGSKILQRYSGYGYPVARLETSCQLLNGEAVACEPPRMPRGCIARSLEELAGRCRWEEGERRAMVCNRVDHAPRCQFEGGVNRDQVIVKHRISEGPQVTVGPMLLKGNFDTDSSVIYREIPLERDALLDTQKVIEGQGNLRSLNLFDSVSIESIGLDEGVRDADEATAALLINVEESRTREVEFKFGLELREVFSDQFQLLVTGESEYVDRNVFGQGLGVQPRLISALDTLDLIRLGRSTAEELEAAREITSLDFLLGAEIIMSHPRFLKSATGIDKLYATLTPFYLVDLVGVINRQVLREEGGVRVELRKELFEILKRFYLKFGIEVKSIASFAPDGPVIDGRRIFSPRRTIGKISPELALDRRDSPLNPTDGFFLRLEPALVSGDAFGRGGERFVQDSFLRLTASFSYYTPLWKDVVFGQGLRAGQIFPLFDRERPVQADERYFLGGVRSVRGFPDGFVGPVTSNQVPMGGEFLLNYNAELRYPLLRKFSVYGATFFDAGLLTDCRPGASAQRDCYADAFADAPLGNVRTAAGLGLRALILDQIPLVLDYGIVLNRQPGEKFGQVHFNVGYTFD